MLRSSRRETIHLVCRVSGRPQQRRISEFFTTPSNFFHRATQGKTLFRGSSADGYNLDFGNLPIILTTTADTLAMDHHHDLLGGRPIVMEDLL